MATKISLMSTGLAGCLDKSPVIRDHENVVIKNPKRKRRNTGLIILRLSTLNYGLNHPFSGLEKMPLYDSSGPR